MRWDRKVLWLKRPDRIGQTETAQTETAQTESPRTKSRVPFLKWSFINKKFQSCSLGVFWKQYQSGFALSLEMIYKLRNRPFSSGRFGLRRFGLSHFGLGRFGLADSV